jgi:hypothetical protein
MGIIALSKHVSKIKKFFKKPSLEQFLPYCKYHLRGEKTADDSNVSVK